MITPPRPYRVSAAGKVLRAVLLAALMLQTFAPLIPTGGTRGRLPRAEASTVTSASFNGGAGTVSVGGTLYAKQGASLTLTVNTSNDTKCVEVSGAFTATQTSATAKSTWTFSFTAGAGDGVQTVTATARPNFNQNNCTGQPGSGTVSFVLDNTGPTVTATLSPTPNAAGWNNSAVTITWSATDAGSGVASGPTPATDSVTSDGVVTKTATASDQLGNSGTGSVTVKLDKSAPTITGSRSPAANANGWNNTDVTVTFTCNDGLSGIKSCSGTTTLSGEGANQSVTGTAVDNANNSATATVGGINIDKTAPTLTGAPTTSPNAAGWYRSNVTVHWTCSDGLSGLDGACPADSTISGEGTGLTVTASVSDKAGNTSTATSSPPVNIDKTPPNTTAVAPTGWNNSDVTITLTASDGLSGVAATYYRLNGGTPQTGGSVAISSEGTHTLEFWSVDQAGNEEPHKTVQVKIDKTPPTITHTQSPAANANGWNNTNVTVTFTCNDALSGVASCTAPQTVTTEGKDQPVTGTATDNAGNTATDPATVSIDKTPPQISAAPDRPANAHGWYNADVIVTFTCSDTLSGLATCPAPVTVGEGANQTASGTAKDAADNSATAQVTGLNVDKTPPTLTGTPSASGWTNADVTVTWSCGDTLSGIDGACPAPSTVTGEGVNLSASASVLDRAGNGTTTTVSGIKIDRTPPNTTASVPAPLPSGWYAGPVSVTLSATDALSGVATTFYSVDGGAPQTYSGPFTFNQKGTHTLTFWSVDNAGNVEDKTAGGHSITLKIDNIPPSTGATLTPPTPDGTQNWYVTAVNVQLSAADAESGVAATYYRIDDGAPQTYSGPFTFNQSGSHTLTFWSVDNAGNVEDPVAKHNSIVIQFDNDPPTITEKSRTPAPNSFGWNNTDVTISFTCTDSTSQVFSCADVTVSSEGAGQTAVGVAVDNAGNSASLMVTNINIDKTPPTVTGAPTTSPNAAGWYNSNVTIHWTCSDGLSGIATCPLDSVISSEGQNLSAGPVTASDKAGNQSAPATVSGIKIDKTPPTISGGPTTNPNAAGWYNSAVTVHFTCQDALSGVATCPGDKVLAADGANQSVTSDPATDLAGNSSPGKTVGGINIDSKAPTTGADLQCTQKNGYCRGNKATVNLTAVDQPGLSGVKEIRYSTNNGNSWQSVSGATTSVDINLTGSGKAKVLFYAVDNAGNSESVNGVEIKYDTIAPTVTHALTPPANAAGWNKDNVTVTFTAEDDSDGSGVETLAVDGVIMAAQASNTARQLTASKSVTNETSVSGLVINAEAEDFAGNKGTDAATVKLDKTAPTISAVATTADGKPYTPGVWTNQAVTVTFTCSDALSGIATCPAPVTVTQPGGNQTVTGTAVDAAGNTKSVSAGPINIDTQKPTITVNGLTNGALYTLGAVPTGSCIATDDLSGLAGACSFTVSGGLANGVGTFTYTATATDIAGNTATVTGTYRVVYRWDGFLQPINDTAHQVDVSVSIFKAGSTVPTKFQLKRADGTVVQANSLPVWLTPARGSATTAPVDESMYSDPADSGSTYRWDSTSQQYIYNWGSPKNGAGYYWRIGVKLDDGQTYYVNIGLR